MSSPQRSESAADERRPARPIAVRVADATTRLILIAITAGGLLTVVMNISRLQSLADLDPLLTQSTEVAPVEDRLSNGFPLMRAIVHGDEAAARSAIVQVGRDKLISEAERTAGNPNRRVTDADGRGPFDGALELAADVHGNWKIVEMQDMKRVIIGVLQTGPDPAILFWGGYDETGPGEWSTWTIQLPLAEK